MHMVCGVLRGRGEQGDGSLPVLSEVSDVRLSVTLADAVLTPVIKFGMCSSKKGICFESSVLHSWSR